MQEVIGSSPIFSTHTAKPSGDYILTAFLLFLLTAILWGYDVLAILIVSEERSLTV